MDLLNFEIARDYLAVLLRGLCGDRYPHPRRHCMPRRLRHPGGARTDVAQPADRGYRSSCLCRGHARHAAAAAARLYLLCAAELGVNLAPASLAAIVGLTLNYTAYMSEVYRGGIMAVPKSQWEAAATVGMTRAGAFRRIVLPQALRIVTPALGNYFISLFKDTALASVVTVQELTFTGPDHLGAFLSVLHHLYGDRHSLLSPSAIPPPSSCAGLRTVIARLSGRRSTRDRACRHPQILRDAGGPEGVSLTVGAGEVVCIIGPSGSGKSTLLRCINHLEVPDARCDSGRRRGRLLRPG